HTPGHSPDSICLLVGDRTRGEEPWLVLTGDTLFVGDAGRPDLESSGAAAEAAAGRLHESLLRLLTLPDDLEVYPGHFAGSAFVGAMVGLERAVLPVIAVRDFHLVAAGSVLGFIVSFGLVKAATNLAAGGLADSLGRKWVLVVGWLFAVPVPLIILTAPTWGW